MYINLIQDMCEDSSTSVNKMCGETDNLNVGVGVHQGLALSPFLLSVLMDEVTR